MQREWVTVDQEMGRALDWTVDRVKGRGVDHALRYFNHTRGARTHTHTHAHAHAHAHR